MPTTDNNHNIRYGLQPVCSGSASGSPASGSASGSRSSSGSLFVQPGLIHLNNSKLDINNNKPSLIDHHQNIQLNQPAIQNHLLQHHAQSHGQSHAQSQAHAQSQSQSQSQSQLNHIQNHVSIPDIIDPNPSPDTHQTLHHQDSQPPNPTSLPAPDHAPIVEIAHILSQPGGQARLSPAQNALWNDYQRLKSAHNNQLRPNHPSSLINKPAGQNPNQNPLRIHHQLPFHNIHPQQIQIQQQQIQQQQQQLIQQQNHQKQLLLQQQAQPQIPQSHHLQSHSQHQLPQLHHQQQQPQQQQQPHQQPQPQPQPQPHQQQPQQHQQQQQPLPILHQQRSSSSSFHRTGSALFNQPMLPRSATPVFSPQQPSLTNGHRQSSVHLESPPSRSPPKHPKPASTPHLAQKSFNTGFDQPLVPDHPSPAHPSSFAPGLPSPSSSSRHPLKQPPIATPIVKLPSSTPLRDDGSKPPPKLSRLEQSQVAGWVRNEEAFEANLLSERAHKRAALQDTYREMVIANRSDWLGEPSNTRPPARLRIRMPADDEREKATGKRKNRPRLKLSKRDLALVAEAEEVLVPIRLEIEVEHWKLRDTFTWNLKEPVLIPEQFAAHLCEDLILPTQHFLAPIVSSIKEQLDEYKLHENFEGHYASQVGPEEEALGHVKLGGASVASRAQPGLQTGGAGKQRTEEAWWAEWRQRVLAAEEALQSDSEFISGRESKRLKLDCDDIDDGGGPSGGQSDPRAHLVDYDDPDLRPEPVEAFSVSMDMRDDELRIPIVLDIISGNIHLTDRFEWEIGEVNNSPEDFVEVYVNDLGLAGEFKTAIAHSIREQIETYVKSLALVEHINGYPVPNDELRYAFLGRVSEPIRTGTVDDFTPFLNFLSAEELDRQEREHDREARRKRRQTRSRRGITLPDRESQRTVRSIVPIQGNKMVVTYQDDNDDLVVPLQPIAEPFPIKESAVEIHDPPEYLPKRQVAVPKEPHPAPDSQLGTPHKAVAHRISRRLRGATADVGPSGTPPPGSTGKAPSQDAGQNVGGDKEDVPTPSNSGTPVPLTMTTVGSKKTLNKQDQGGNLSGSKKTGGTMGINWDALGLHDPMIDGVWHCSNCGCPEHVAVGRRKGLGGKDTLCGECGRYMHRFKKNRPTIYNTSADYHTSLKLEADKAKQAIADQQMLRKEKNRLEARPAGAGAVTNSSKKRKKDARGSVCGKTDKPLRRAGDRADSVVSSARSAASRESSPSIGVRGKGLVGREKERASSSKRSRMDDGPEQAPTTRAQKGLASRLALGSPGSGSEAEVQSPTNGRTRPAGVARALSGSLVPESARSSISRNSARNSEGRASVGGPSRKASEKPDEHERAAGVEQPEAKAAAVAKEEGQMGSGSGSGSGSNGTQPVKHERMNSKASGLSAEGEPVSSQPLVGSSSVASAKAVESSERKTQVGRPPRHGRPSAGGAGGTGAGGRIKFEPPAWMVGALGKLRQAYPADRVELVPKPRQQAPVAGSGQKGPVVLVCDWRLKCMDCPGKLYTVGPGESFTNFDVHLKNRLHRLKVDERLNGVSASLPSSQQQPQRQQSGPQQQPQPLEGPTTVMPQPQPGGSTTADMAGPAVGPPEAGMPEGPPRPTGPPRPPPPPPMLVSAAPRIPPPPPPMVPGLPMPAAAGAVHHPPIPPVGPAGGNLHAPMLGGGGGLGGGPSSGLGGPGLVTTAPPAGGGGVGVGSGNGPHHIGSSTTSTNTNTSTTPTTTATATAPTTGGGSSLPVPPSTLVHPLPKKPVFEPKS